VFRVFVACVAPTRGAAVLLPFVLAVAGPAQSAPCPPNLPVGVASFGAARAGGRLFVVGGHLGPTHTHARANLTGGVWSWSAKEGGTWRQHADDAPLQGAAVVAVGEGVWRIGGLAALNDEPEREDLRSSATVRALDASADRWNDAPSLPAARSSHDACVVDGRVFVVGGWNVDGAAKTWRDRMLVLDLARPHDGWSERPQPFRRRALAVAVAGGRILACGGLDEHGRTSRAVDVYDVASGAWTRGADLPGDGFGCSATTLGGAAYVLLADGTLATWDAAKNAFAVVDRIAVPRMFPELVALDDGRAAVLGGAVGVGRTTLTEVVQTTVGAPFASAVGDIRFPGAARQRSAASLDGARLHLVGGNRTVEQHDFRAASFVDEHVVADLARGEARVVGRAPDSRQSAVAVADRAGGATALGGFGPAADDRGRSLDGALRVRPKPPETTAASLRLPLPLTQFGAFRHDGALYVVGGLDYAGNRSDAFRLSTAVYRAPETSDEGGFVPVPELTLAVPRRAFGCAVLDGRAYVVGGMTDSFRSVADCESLDLGARRRELFPAPRRPRISPELLAVGGRLFLCGGLSDRGEGLRPDASVEVFDPVERRWSVATENAPLTGPHVGVTAFDARRLLYWTTFAAEGRLRFAFLDLGSFVPRG
jgi:hypothetical protein